MKYPTISELITQYENGTLKGDYFLWALESWKEERPQGFITRAEIIEGSKLKEELRTEQHKFMWEWKDN